MKIRHESIPFVLIVWVVGLVLSLLLPGMIGLATILTAFILYFFRDPERSTPSDTEGLILSPADGKVVLSRLATPEECARYALPEGSYKLAIFLNVFNVHVTRTPVSGIVRSTVHRLGPKYPAFYEKSSDLNEHVDVEIESAQNKVIVRLIAGLVARRIVPWIKEGDTLRAGQRIGLIKFGSRADVYWEPSFQVAVALGDKVVAGETVIANQNKS